MNRKLLITFILGLILTPNIFLAQAPNLGTSANFVTFSSVGAVTNKGTSLVTGDVGTNSGSSTGFGNVNGIMNDNNGSSAQCSADVLIAYQELNNETPTFFIAPLLGNGQVLISGVYSVSGASTINQDLILDAENDADAVFIFQIGGPLSTAANTKVKLINGAKACNVFWKVEGLVDMAAQTSMKGTVIANNAAINMNTNDTLEGRLLTTSGAITIDGVLAYTPVGCGSAILTGPTAPDLGRAACFGIFSKDGPVTNSGITNVKGDVGANVGLTTGFDQLLVDGDIHPTPDNATLGASDDLLIAYNYINTLSSDIELLYSAQFGNNLVLTPHTYVINGATTFTDSLYLNAMGNPDAVFVIKIYGALSTSASSKVILINGALAKNVYWLVNGAVEINVNSIFNGNIIAMGAVNLFTGVVLNGRALTGVGAITTAAINVLGNEIPGNCSTISGVRNSENDDSSVTIYPNPFNDFVSIKLDFINSDFPSDLRIYNSLGMLVLQQSITEAITELNIDNLTSGIYFYKLTGADNSVSSGKIISE